MALTEFLAEMATIVSGMVTIIGVVLLSHHNLSGQMGQMHEDIRHAHERIDTVNARMDKLMENNQTILLGVLNQRHDKKGE